MVIPATMAHLNPKTEASASMASRGIQAINLPGSFIDFAIDRLTTASSQDWPPQATHLSTWRGIALIIFCLPFWCFAGLGFDAVMKRCWIRSWTGLAGSLLCLVYLLLFVRMVIGSPAIESQRPASALCGLALWSVLLSPFILTSLRQWLTLRRMKASLEARLFAEVR